MAKPEPLECGHCAAATIYPATDGKDTWFWVCINCKCEWTFGWGVAISGRYCPTKRSPTGQRELVPLGRLGYISLAEVATWMGVDVETASREKMEDALNETVAAGVIGTWAYALDVEDIMGSGHFKRWQDETVWISIPKNYGLRDQPAA